MITPTLNNNGSSADDLIQPRIAAYDALHDAIFALQKATPHGRDYPGDIDRCTIDHKAHYDRLNTLHVMAAEIVAEAVAIREQVA